MRILQVIYSLRRGGAERVVRDLACGMVKRGHDVRICTLVRENTFEEDLRTCAGGPVEWEALLDGTPRSFLPHLPTLTVRLRKVLRVFRPDIIHCHLTPDSVLCSFVRDTPIVRSVQTMRPIKGYLEKGFRSVPLRWLERRALLNGRACLVACSTTVANILSPYLTTQRRLSLEVILNGRDFDQTIETGHRAVDEKARNIVMTGTLDNEFKNQAMALRAMAELKKRGESCRLWLLSGGPDQGFLKSLARDLNVDDCVQFFGGVPRVEDYLYRASLFWMTSRFEGMPIALIEAMAAGLPVVATRISSIQEVLQPWPEVLVESDDHMGLAQLTAGLLGDYGHRTAIGAAMKAYALKNFSADRMVEDYLEVYRKQLALRRVSSGAVGPN